MTDVPLAFSDDPRTYAGLPRIALQNRFVEQNLATAKGSAMIARPGTDELEVYGDGPIRSIFSLPGLFGGAAFIASGNSMFRREVDGTVIPMAGFIYNSADVSMTGVEGAGYQHLFIADGSLLQVYRGGTQASGILTATAQPADADVVRIGDVYYSWVTTVVNGAGTAASPWRVLIGADLNASMNNMLQAISFTGTQGVTYSANLGGQNPQVTAAYPGLNVDDDALLTVTARTDLAAGNDLATTETGANMAWGAATLTGGGTHALSGVAMPDGLPPIAVATLKSFVLVAIGNSDRFYWIRPAEITIAPLDFATAESQPDDVLTVEVVGDTAWFVGEGSTEVWYATGVAASPFAPVPGRVFDRGAIEGTVVNIKGSVFLVGRDYVVYAIAGAPNRISNHGVEQTIRTALEA